MTSKHSQYGFAEYLLNTENDGTILDVGSAAINQFQSELDAWVAEARLGEQRTEAAARMIHCRNHKAPRLDLSRLGLTSLPGCIGQLTHLEWLLVVFNELTALPAAILKLRELVGLYISFNRVTALPDQIGDLTRLQHLRLDHNHLETLPESLGQLRNLRQLSFRDNRIASLPDEVRVLPLLDGETHASLLRMEQENRVAHLEQRAKNISTQLKLEVDIAMNSIGGATQDDTTAAPMSGLMGLLALQRAQLGVEESALRHEIRAIKTDIAVQDAQWG